MLTDEIRNRLFALRDETYRAFQSKLIPTIDPERIIGVRMPVLRAYARELRKEQGEMISEFLRDLPHRYYDEDQLHGMLISDIRDYGECAKAVEDFLPYVDNWATCDLLSPKVFKKHRRELLEYIRGWIASGETYRIRFGIGMLMTHFLEEDFDLAYPEMVADVKSEEYYVNMMIAWYFATALAKQYEAVLPFIEEQRLELWTHNKTIQKAVESYRITQEQKEYLKRLRRKRV